MGTSGKRVEDNGRDVDVVSGGSVAVVVAACVVKVARAVLASVEIWLGLVGFCVVRTEGLSLASKGICVVAVLTGKHNSRMFPKKIIKHTWKLSISVMFMGWLSPGGGSW